MIKFDNVEVYNFDNAIRGMRNSWQSWDKLDSYWEDPTSFVIGEADHKLMMNLVKAGPEHGKFLRQIFISVDITAPLKWWDEIDQYHFFDTNSTSAMHTLGRGEIVLDDFSSEDWDSDLGEDYINLINTARERWFAAGKKKPSKEWRQLIMLTAMGFNYRRTFTSNYAQLRTMYFQRKNHRLQEWRDMADWIESLPYSELITLKTK